MVKSNLVDSFFKEIGKNPIESPEFKTLTERVKYMIAMLLMQGHTKEKLVIYLSSKNFDKLCKENGMIRGKSLWGEFWGVAMKVDNTMKGRIIVCDPKQIIIGFDVWHKA